MSRTYKDRRWDLRFPESDWRFGMVEVPFEHTYICPYKGVKVTRTRFNYLLKAGVKTKKKKADHNKWDWIGATPSWWTRMMMNRPQRRSGRMWERKVLFSDIEEADAPGVSRKPHIYYY